MCAECFKAGADAWRGSAKRFRDTHPIPGDSDKSAAIADSDRASIVGAGQVGIDISGDEVKIGGTVYESAWLIEKVGVHLCYSRDAGSCLTWVTFSDSAAWRFDDKASAERVIDDTQADRRRRR